MPKCGIIALQLIEIALRHWCSPVNLLNIFRTPFPRKTSGRLLLYLYFLAEEIALQIFYYIYGNKFSSISVNDMTRKRK